MPTLIILLCLLVLTLSGCAPANDATPPASPAPTEEEVRETARAIHERVLTLDTHVDIPFDYATPEVDPGRRGEFQVDLPKMEEGGLDAAFFIVYVGRPKRTR
jgi:membrane dipeptidase